MGEVLPVLDRLALAAAHLPGPSGEEGAVWYEVAADDDGSVAVALGNVRDATVAERLRRAVAGLDPAAALECLDQHARAMPAVVGSTALCVTFDPAGVVRWSAAGHTPPLVAGPDGVRYLDGGQGEPFGHPRRPVVAEEPLPAGSTVVLCSGGPPTSCGPAADPVATAVAHGHQLAPAALAQALAESAGNGSPDRPARTLLLARLMPAPLEQRLPAAPRKLSAVRRAVARWSAQAALSDDATADLQLLLSEAITNAVEHAYRDAEAGEFVYSVRRRRDAGVRVVVQDFGRWRPPPDDPGYRGRGLAVIQNLAEEMTLDFSDHGTRIAFTVPSDPPAPRGAVAERDDAGLDAGPMTTELADAIGYLPFPLGVTATPEHVVVALNTAGRTLLGDLVGRPVRVTLPHTGLLAALDAAYHDTRPGSVSLLAPPVTVGCAPVRDGVLLHVTAGDASGADRARSSALQRLTGELSHAATPEEIARLVVTSAADLLGADGAGVFSRTGASMTALHRTGWDDAITRRYERIPVQRGRPLSDAVLTGVPVWLENAEQWRVRYPEMAPVGTSQGFQATVCLPMRVEGRDLGALVFSFLTPRAFLEEEREYLQAVTALSAQALDRARLLVGEQDARAAVERQLDRMTFLARAGRLMEAPLSLEERLQRLADLAVPDTADWCAVHLVRNDRVEQVAVAHSDPEKVAFVAALQERYPPDPDADGGAIQVSRTGEPAFFPEIPDELLAAAAVDDEHLALIRSIGLRSAVVVPLLVRGRSLGALTLVHAESEQRFDEVDLAFAEQLALNAAVALDNARLYEQQLSIAETLQTALLPAALPEVAGLRLAARYRAQSDERSGVHGSGIHVGGDLYDVVACGAGRWVVVMADVCGKGPTAAALTALIRHTLRAEIDHGLGPAEVLHRLNRAMLHAAGTAPVRFATVALAQLTVDAAGAAVRLASGGHPPLLIRRGDRVEPVAAPGTLLGVYADVELTEVTFRLDRGDMMVLYTDGVTEARGVDGMYGTERLTRLLRSFPTGSADAVADALLDDVVGFQRGRLRDDVAILVVEATP